MMGSVPDCSWTDIYRQMYPAAVVTGLLPVGMKAFEASFRLPTAVYL
jgi:hypothetical protein